MTKFDWKSLVGSVAPALATAFGGPAAGLAVSALSQAVLGHPNGSEDDLQTALAKATPETLAAIKKADQEFAAKMKQLDIDLDALNVKDREGARDLRKSTGDITPDILTGIILISFIGMCWAILSGWATGPLANTAIAGFAGMLIRDIGHALQQSLKFWFGGSADDSADEK